MMDTANPGAAMAGTPADATVPPATNGSPAGGAADFLAGLRNAESRQWVESKGFKALDPLVESARHADRIQSEFNDLKAKALTPPAPDARPEEWQAFYSRLGRPDTAEGYEFRMPQGLPEGFAYDSESAKAYRGWAHEAGLSPRQAQGLHDRFVQYQAGQQGAYVQAIVQRGESAQTELVRAWGDRNSESFRANVQFADRFIHQNGGQALMGELKANGLISPDGYVLSPVLAQAMAKAGRALYAEDQFATGGVAGESRSAAETLYPVDPFRR
ncbi:hypothetical protein [Labrys neptuniae]